MLAQKAYEETAVGAIGTMTYSGIDQAGHVHDEAGYEQFAVFVAYLESLAESGLIRIETRHLESKTGKRYVDMVRFKRIE